MKKIGLLIILCLFPYLGNTQNYYKNSTDVYYNMDTVGSILTESLHLPIIEVINSDLLSKIEKCVNNYEKKVIMTPDSSGTYFGVTIFGGRLEDTTISISPEANFYLSSFCKGRRETNEFYKEMHLKEKVLVYYQNIYIGCFYYRNYLFIVMSNSITDTSLVQQYFNNTSDYICLKLYESPKLLFYKDKDIYYLMGCSYKIKKNKKGKISFETNE